jgi:hypothetical protein
MVRIGPSSIVVTTRIAISESDRLAAGRGFVFTGVLLGVMLLASVGLQLAPTGGADRLNGPLASYTALWPQGWSMYSDASRHQSVVVYSVQPGNRGLTLVTRPSAASTRWWGVSRVAYSEVVQSTELAAQIPAGSWRTCEGVTLVECWRGGTPAEPHRLSNMSRRPVLCGQLVFASESPARWTARGTQGRPGRQPTRLAPAVVWCPR